MPHIDGNDDGIGYGVFGRSIQPFGVGVLATSREYIGLFRRANMMTGYTAKAYGVMEYMVQPLGNWFVWRKLIRTRCVRSQPN